jgi:hypothetical protein
MLSEPAGPGGVRSQTLSHVKEGGIICIERGRVGGVPNRIDARWILVTDWITRKPACIARRGFERLSKRLSSSGRSKQQRNAAYIEQEQSPHDLDT